MHNYQQKKEEDNLKSELTDLFNFIQELLLKKGIDFNIFLEIHLTFKDFMH